MSRCYHCGEVDAHCYLCRGCGQIYCILHKDPEVHECNLIRGGSQYLQESNHLYAQNEGIGNFGENAEMHGRTDGNYTWYRPLGIEYQEFEGPAEVQIITLGRLVLNKDSIKELVGRSILQGNGSIQNPYSFKKLTTYPSSIFISGIECYLHLEGFTLRSLVLRDCKNITINGNKIGVLSLINCSDLSIIKNLISTLRFKRIEGNFISGNKMSKLAFKELKSCNDGAVRLANFLGILATVLVSMALFPLALFLFFLEMPILGGVVITCNVFLALGLQYLIEKKVRKIRVIEKPNIITENYILPSS